ncbi:type IV pilus biogenesis/stability protein PilW [Moraxella osloensis]|nr:type IV pilus biogenesis/stability protein PilW [Moraxella osloensis]BAV11770.1 putative type IV pilus biogenesis/stability protein PilW [Moraxella osloensis]
MIGLSSFSLCLTGCTTTRQVTTQTVTASDPSRWEKNPEEIARIRTAIAAEYIRGGKLDDAKRQLESALKSYPKSAEANDMMGVLLQQEGSPRNMQKAEAYFKNAIALNPDFSQANNNYGVYLAQLSRNQEAIAQFQIAGSALGYDGRASALENLGRTALKVKNKPLAIQSFIKALDANRQSIVARTELIDILLTDGKFLEAQALYNDLVKIIGQANLDPRTLSQGIRLAKLANNPMEMQKLAQQLLDRYPLSDEAKQIRSGLLTPTSTWK